MSPRQCAAAAAKLAARGASGLYIRLAMATVAGVLTQRVILVDTNSDP